MSSGLVPGNTAITGNCGASMSGSSARGMFKRVVTPTTTIIRKITSVNW